MLIVALDNSCRRCLILKIRLRCYGALGASGIQGLSRSPFIMLTMSALGVIPD